MKEQSERKNKKKKTKETESAVTGINPESTAISLEAVNRKRHLITMTSSVIFIIAAVLAFFTSFGLFVVAEVRSEAEYLETGQYQIIYYDGEFYERGYHIFESEEEMRYVFAEDGYEEPEKFTLKTYTLKTSYDRAALSNISGILWSIDLISIILLPITLILAVSKTGAKKPVKGVILNAFDKIFSEVQIVLAIMVSILAYPAAILFDNWINGTKAYQDLLAQVFGGLDKALSIDDLIYYLDPFHGYYRADYLFAPNWVQLIIALIFVLGFITFDIAVILSIARKLKNRSFLRSTILGSISYGIADFAAESPYLTLKTLVPPIGVIALSFIASDIFINIFGYESPPFIFIIALLLVALILVTLPPSLRKYRMVKNGIEELQHGNFDYKIPDMGKGELASLARSVNAISEAQNIAINNEIKSQRLRTDLISNVSHDLRTPLTSMVSYVNLLNSEGLDSENAPEYLKIISEKTDRLQKLTEDLFEAAKASSGDIPVNLEKIEMNSLTAQALAEVEESLTKQNINVILKKPDQDTYVLADGKLLWRVIENLLINVSKYALPGSRAYVDIFPSNGMVTLEVKNMSREQLNISSDELMERFKRGDSSRNTDGSGLGLTIARDLTSLMRGSFDITIDGDLFKATVKLRQVDELQPSLSYD